MYLSAILKHSTLPASLFIQSGLGVKEITLVVEKSLFSWTKNTCGMVSARIFFSCSYLVIVIQYCTIHINDYISRVDHEEKTKTCSIF